MDLALELGFTSAQALKRTMTEHELGQWFAYARKRWMPGRRLELLLANIARLSAGSDSIAPFIFDPSLRQMLEPPTVETIDGATNAIAAISGAGVYKLGQRKIKDILNGK